MQKFFDFPEPGIQEWVGENKQEKRKNVSGLWLHSLDQKSFSHEYSQCINIRLFDRFGDHFYDVFVEKDLFTVSDAV
jgi:hypothetical protein